MNAVAQPRLSLSRYLTWEAEQAERHEYHRGEAFPMVGARRAHGRVVSNLVRRLGEALDGSPCQVFAESMKLQVADDTNLYPDLFVTCDSADLAMEQIFRAPTLVVEVLSPGTGGHDRGQRFALYRRLPSLREYLLVDPQTRRVEDALRRDDGTWTFSDLSAAATLHLASLGVVLALAQVFEGVDPPDAPAAGAADA